MSRNDATGPIWVFDETRLDEALQAYEAEARATYPNQEARIRTTVLAMRDFLHSVHAAGLRMRPGTEH